jgi:hypothetical protein
MPDARQLHLELKKEWRDPAWAPTAEAGLREALSPLTQLPEVRTFIRVTCGATLCEVTGWFEASKGDRLNAAMDVIQGGGLVRAAERLRLTSESGIAFSGRKEEPGRGYFIAYYKRAPA